MRRRAAQGVRTVGIVLKGSGFYKNDSRTVAGSNGSGSKGADAPSSESSNGESSSKKESSGSEKSGSEKGAPDKSGSEKSGSEKSGSAKGSPSKDTAPASSSAELRRPLVAAERHVGDGQGLTGGDPGEPTEIPSDFDDRLEHALQRGGDGDLPHGLSQGAP